MTAISSRPIVTDTHAVYCRRCNNPRPLAVVGPGTLILKHKHLEHIISGLTPRQRIRAKCPRCTCVQDIEVPPGMGGNEPGEAQP